MMASTVSDGVRISWRWVIWLVLAAAVIVAAVSLFKVFGLTSDVNHLSKQLKATNAEIATVRQRVAAQSGASAGDLKTLRTNVSALQAKAKLYDDCLPEVMGQINSLQANVVSTGPLYVSPSQSVSRFCQSVLYGSPTGTGQ
jgi:hypothetical protein